MSIRIVICGHSDMSLGLRSAAEMICGTQCIEALPFREGDNLYTYSDQIKRIVTNHEADGNAVVVLADLLGGTPYNAAVLALAGSGLKAKLFAGANLAMVLEIAMLSDMADLDAQEIVAAAKTAVCEADLSAYLN